MLAAIGILIDIVSGRGVLRGDRNGADRLLNGGFPAGAADHAAIVHGVNAGIFVVVKKHIPVGGIVVHGQAEGDGGAVGVGDGIGDGQLRGEVPQVTGTRLSRRHCLIGEAILQPHVVPVLNDEHGLPCVGHGAEIAPYVMAAIHCPREGGDQCQDAVRRSFGIPFVHRSGDIPGFIDRAFRFLNQHRIFRFVAVSRFRIPGDGMNPLLIGSVIVGGDGSCHLMDIAVKLRIADVAPVA